MGCQMTTTKARWTTMELNTAPCIPPWSPLSPWHRCTVERDRGGSWRLWGMLRWVFHALPWTAEACPARCDAHDSHPSRTAFPGYPVSARVQHRMNLLVHVTHSCYFDWQGRVVKTWVGASNEKGTNGKQTEVKEKIHYPFVSVTKILVLASFHSDITKISNAPLSADTQQEVWRYRLVIMICYLW